MRNKPEKVIRGQSLDLLERRAKELEFNLADHGKLLGEGQKLLDQSFRQIKKAVLYGMLGRQGPEVERGPFRNLREQESGANKVAAVETARSREETLSRNSKLRIARGRKISRLRGQPRASVRRGAGKTDPAAVSSSSQVSSSQGWKLTCSRAGCTVQRVFHVGM